MEMYQFPSNSHSLSFTSQSSSSSLHSSLSSLHGDDSYNSNDTLYDKDFKYFTKYQIEQLDKMVYLTSTLGCIGSLFIIVTFLIFKDIRSSFASKLIFYLSISDLMVAISYFPFGRQSKEMCDIQGIGLMFFLSSSYFWTMCISISIYLVFVLNQIKVDDLMKYFHLVSWGIPLLSTLISIKYDIFGRTGSWCFIGDPKSLFKLFYYLPLLFVFIVNITIFILLRYKLSKSNNMAKRMNVIMIFYILSFSVSQLPAFINSLHFFYHPFNPEFTLFVLNLVQPLQGLLNAVVYGINEGFTSRYKEFFNKYVICRCCKSRDYLDNTTTQPLIVNYSLNDDEDEDYSDEYRTIPDKKPPVQDRSHDEFINLLHPTHPSL